MSARHWMLVLALLAPLPAAADGDDLPAPVSRLEPVYPRDALRDAQEGFVDLLVEVRADGTVSQAAVIRSEPPKVFDGAAEAAVRQWRFARSDKPSRRGIQRVEFKMDAGVGGMMALPPEATAPPVIRQTQDGIMLAPPDAATDAGKKPKP